MNKELPSLSATDAQDVPLPDYKLLFGLQAWIENILVDWPYDLSEPSDLLVNANIALSGLTELAMAKEGKTYLAMIEAVYAGEFDRD